MLQIDPLKRPPNAELELAGSKSITNRALLIAALAEENLPYLELFSLKTH